MAGLGLGPGIRAGLFGGSFNPAHAGHVAVSDAARRACRLDRVVWLVSPGNPLKNPADYLPLAERLARARAMTAGRAWLHVTAIETLFGTTYTADTLARLTALSRAQLVWIMGADSLATFDKWHDWRGIAERMPILTVSRPGQTLPALTGRAARAIWRSKVPELQTLISSPPPAWSYIHTVHDPRSATAIRALDGPLVRA